jgi:hypothetical protein
MSVASAPPKVLASKSYRPNDEEAVDVQEVCYCGRRGEIESREPVRDGGVRALRCPDCGHLDDLSWIPDDARSSVFEEAERRGTREAA